VFDIQLERAVLSSIITRTNFCDLAMEKLDSSCFSVPEFETAFKRAEEVWSDNGSVNLVTFFAKYKINDMLSVEIVTRDSQVLFHDPEFDNAVKRLVELKKCREIALQSEKTLTLAESGKLEEALRVGTDTFFGVELDKKSAKIVTQEEHANQIRDMILNPKKQNREGYYTRFKGINQRINGGFSAGDLAILSAPTGHGKTLLSMNLMESFAMVQKVPTLYVNTEMSEDQINARWITLLSNHKGINYRGVITGDLPEAGKEIALKSEETLRNSQFFSITIDDLNIKSLEVVLRRYKAKLGIKIAFVDYVGRMDTQSEKLQEWQVLVRIAKRLKTLAQQLDMAIFMVAQQTEEGHLQGSKAMKNEATVFIVLDRPKEVDANLDESKRTAKKLGRYREKGADGALVIQKNRVGPEGRILIKFHEDQLRFEEVFE
jgi:Replicative DNA helicase